MEEQWFCFRRPSDFKSDWLSTAFNNNSKCEKPAALPFHVYKTAKLSDDFGARLETVRIAVKYGGNVERRSTNGVEDRSASFT